MKPNRFSGITRNLVNPRFTSVIAAINTVAIITAFGMNRKKKKKKQFYRNVNDRRVKKYFLFLSKLSLENYKNNGNLRIDFNTLRT